MDEKGMGCEASSMLRTSPNTIKRGEVQGEYVVRGAKMQCSRGDGYDVINLPLCHGVYSGDEPLINIKDMEVHKNICNGFGVCTTSSGEKKDCQAEMMFHLDWINRKKVRFNVDGEEAVTTNSINMCSKHGGEITFVDSGQTAVHAPKDIKAKEDMMAEEARDKTLDSMTSLMACESYLKDLKDQYFDKDSTEYKKKAIAKQANKIREHMVYLAESSPVKPEILENLKRSTKDGTETRKHLRPDELMAINIIREGIKKASEGDGESEQGIWETTVEYAGNLASNPLETATATGGVVLGVVGFIGSGAIEYFTAGTGSWLAVPAGTFSANTALSSAADLKFIATGEMDELGSFNLVKDGSEGLFWAAGEGVELSYEYFSGEDVEIGDYTKYGGTALYYTSSLAFETKNVSKGFGTMLDDSYHLSKSYNTFGNMTGTVNNVSNAEKAGAATEVIHQMKTWWDTYIAK